MNVIKAELNRQAGRIEVRFDFDKQDLLKVKKIPGARFVPKDPQDKFWKLPVDTTSVRLLKEKFDDEDGKLQLGPVLLAWGRVTVKKETELRSLSVADDAKLKRLPKVLPELAKFIDKSDPPRPYQRADISYMAQANCINANQPGLGKTIETIGGVYEAGEEKGAKLVVAPKTSLDIVWEYELTRHGQKQPVFILSGDDSPAKRAGLIDQIYDMAEKDKDFWVVCTASMMRLVKDDEYDDEEQDEPALIPANPELHDIVWNVAVFDEYHKMGLSNPQSLMYKAVKRLEINRLFYLSGTPMGGKPLKLFGPLQMLDPQRFTSKWRWAQEWLEIEEIETQHGEHQKVHGVRDGREDSFWKHIAPYMIRRTKAEVMDQLPEKQYVEVWCEMTPRQKKQYALMAANAEVKIEEEHLTATSILAEYMRLKQFADAHCKVRQSAEGAEGKWIVKPTEESGKLPHIMQLLDERGITPKGEDDEGDEKVVIASQFADVADMVHKHLSDKGIPALRLGGTKKRRTEQVKEFQQGETRVIVMTTTMGGVSITLNRANTAIILDETWDPDDQEQLEDRIHGRGDLNPVTIYYLRSRDTIEEYIRKVTGGKAALNRDILDLRRLGLRATGVKE